MWNTYLQIILLQVPALWCSLNSLDKKTDEDREACIDAIPVGTSLVVAVYWYPTFCAEIHWLDDLYKYLLYTVSEWFNPLEPP